MPLAAVAAETTCNPLVQPNYPVEMWCRGVPNGSVPDKPLWRVEKTEQYRELADPMLFSDGGRLYLYWGCTPKGGIWGGFVGSVVGLYATTKAE